MIMMPQTASKKKAYVITQGCARSHIEGQLYKDFARANDLEVTGNFRKADFILLNLCGLNASREVQYSYLINNILAKKKADARIIITGCLAKISYDRLKEQYGCDVLTFDELDQLNDMIGVPKKLDDVPYPHTVEENPKIAQAKGILGGSLLQPNLAGLLHFVQDTNWASLLGYMKFPAEHEMMGKYCVRISWGCTSACSYCAIRLARGRLRSKPEDKVLEEVKKGIRQGFKQMILLAEDLYCYGYDVHKQPMAIDLIKKMTALDGDFQLILPDCKPEMLLNHYDEIEAILKTGKIHEIKFAIQSANPRVLKLMNRPFDVKAFQEQFIKLKADNPKVSFCAHIMVGFPQETESEFQDTYDFVEACKFDKVLSFQYSGRPKTFSSTLSGQIPEAVAKARLKRLHKLLIGK